MQKNRSRTEILSGTGHGHCGGVTHGRTLGVSSPPSQGSSSWYEGGRGRGGGAWLWGGGVFCAALGQSSLRLGSMWCSTFPWEAFQAANKQNKQTKIHPSMSAHDTCFSPPFSLAKKCSVFSVFIISSVLFIISCFHTILKEKTVKSIIFFFDVQFSAVSFSPLFFQMFFQCFFFSSKTDFNLIRCGFCSRFFNCHNYQPTF